MKIKKAQNSQWDRFELINKFSLPETSKMADALQISDSLVLLWLFSEILLTENRAQNKLEYHQILFSYALENEARETLTNEQARERLVMDCSCERHEHARKPQPEDEFHKVVPGLSPCFRILRIAVIITVSSINHLDKPGGLLSPWCTKSSKRPWILKVTQSHLINN